MAYVQFYNHGYEYFNEKDAPLFCSDDTHDHLFHYAAEDLSCLPELFHQYISEKMDITTFELKSCPDSSEALERITEKLKSLHPYYKHEYKKVIIKAIGEYFNHLLIYMDFQEKTHMRSYMSHAEWYYERITKLMPSAWITGKQYPNGLYPDDFYHIFKTGASRQDDISNCAARGLPFHRSDQMPVGFSEEINTQCIVYNMLFFLLDISAKDLNTLSAPQRIWLYSRIFHTAAAGQSSMHTANRLSFQLPYTNQSHNTEYDHDMADIFQPLRSLNGQNIGRDGIPDELSACFHAAVECARKIASPIVYEAYEIKSLGQLLDLEIMSMVQAGTMIRKCSCCGKYFAAKDRRSAYCDRINVSGMHCSAVGSKQSFQRKMENDEALRIYNRAYKTHHARIRNGKMKEHNFSLWRLEAKEKLERVRSGELELADFKKWLKK